VSFRTAALRGAGGFWPARGHLWLGRDWFADEHETQRELGRAGWRARWAPGARAQRLLPARVRPGDVLRLRWRYGARLALVGGGRPARVAARTAATSLAGAAVSAARGERATVERAARAAENLGVLLAPLVAHGDLQPTATSSPLRHTVPPPAPPPVRAARARAARAARTALRGRRAGGAAPAILLYHRVEDLSRDPLGLAVRPAHFAEHLAVLADRSAPLEDVAAGRAAPGAVALTFDDGYADNLRHALPALASAGVQATLFVATGPVARAGGFWWDTVDRLLHEAPRGAGRPPLAVAIRDDIRAWPAREVGEREHARAALHGWLQARPADEIASALEQLAAWAEADPAATPDRDRALTVPELRELAAAGPFTLGAHTRSHRSLAPAPPQARREELASSGDDLAAWTGRRPTAVSYPFGVPGVDVDAGHRRHRPRGRLRRRRRELPGAS
jgi:peptidoglycan/xylan/chitin deacetylase (PgdA/CDA1 family)